MANRFTAFGGSPDPSTPDRSARHGGKFSFGTEPSTTPAGPPPSSSNSFTPAGAPSASYLGSSMMRGLTGSKPAAPSFSSGGSGSTSRNLFARKGSSPLTRGGRTAKERGPSGLSQSIRAESIERETPPKKTAGTFRLAFDDFDDDDDDDDDDEEDEREAEEDQSEEQDADGEEEDEEEEEEEEYEQRLPFGRSGHAALDAEVERYLNRDIDAEEESEEEEEEAVGEADGEDYDPFLTMHDEPRDSIEGSDMDEDLMVLTTPAADERARREAENIFRASSIRKAAPGPRVDFQFDAISREHYKAAGPAIINETPDLILDTEDLVSRLYDEGIGAKDDAEKLDSSLAIAAIGLTQIWNDYARELPDPEEEHATEIGPPPTAEPFKKAAFIANLVIRMHHTRSESNFDEGKRVPLPQVLFEWMAKNHNVYSDQFREVVDQRPNPVCHSLYWPTVRTTLLRGEVRETARLLKSADFKHVRKNRGPASYSGKALQNIEYAVKQTCDMLDNCPGANGDWDIFGSDWTLFRVKAKASLDQLQRFAEGKDHQQFGSSDASFSYGNSVVDLARKAESQIPWEVYEQLTSIYDIVIGDQNAILETAQDWCEATVGLCGWWDEEKDRPKKRRLGQSLNLLGPTHLVPLEDYFERMARAVHTAVESDFYFDPRNSVAVAVASAFECNFSAVIGILRAWSLPVASATAEVASLGQWLPKPQAKALLPMDTLDDDDLAVLGVPQQGPDEVEGIKDTTLVQYARELAGVDQISAAREGWEVAIEVLGRMDSVEKSEETVGELLHDLLETLQPDSSVTVDKMWRILGDLGMVSFAEETAEAFADILGKDSHRYGEAVWYYALAHKPAKVREVLNLLISYSLLQSTAYPPPSDLDDHLHRLLTDRGSALEDLANKDIEAAELVGRMLSGYATLRKFYEIRDTEASAATTSATSVTFAINTGLRSVANKKRAATALVAVIASSDDNIRGGLYDETRDAVVSEDFLLALLGEAMVLVGHEPPVLTLEQMDILLKAIEDLETVGSRVYDACDEFFKLVLASAQGLKGSTPADLMKSVSSSGGLGGSYVLSGSSMLASQLHRSISGSSSSGGLARVPKRGWDWRAGLRANSTAEEVLRILRLGLSKELARLWLQDADNVALF